MTLREVAETIRAKASGELDVLVTGVTCDSRQAKPGDLFVAVRGLKLDGHRFIEQALERGAVAILSENPRPQTSSATWLQVENARLALAHAATAIFAAPSRQLNLIGVTGTNGKTTTTYLMDSILEAAGLKSARMGTTTTKIGDLEVTAERTTPEASEIQSFLRQACDAGCSHAVMEVSSHALDLHRVYGCEFAVAVFTNLTRDHLDYHGSMEAYFAAKRKLFDGSMGKVPETAVINLDDPRARDLIAASQSKVLTYGLQPKADVTTDGYASSFGGTRFTAQTPIGQIEIASRLVGKPNVYNTLAALTVGIALGLKPSELRRGIETARQVPGRFEIVKPEGADRPPFLVLVDYAHTDDALRNVLETARELNPNRLITVFGCGGDRDRTKRPLMGKVAGTLSEIVIATSDNPRSEDPDAILQEIIVGLKQTDSRYFALSDRREAIFRAIQEAQPGDIVIIAGKGHETYQVFKDRTIHFDDREVAREALAAVGITHEA
jgi:UDP-N-acetylmuramoyl-L-alanyl-D-glutamate--2,6-diaminopimelate ligase